MSDEVKSKRQLAVLGECMVEIKPTKGSSHFGRGPIDARIGYGGDTLNCSVYLARMNVDVSYVTAVGDDPLSDWIVNQWQSEGIHCDQVQRTANAVPGLYLIDTDDNGERSFFYWRDQAPVRSMFEQSQQSPGVFDGLAEHEYVYLSGITLALFDDKTRQKIYDFLDDYRSKGGKVCFDNNYRPRQWESADTARNAFANLYQRSDIAMPTLDDEQLMYPEESEQDTINRLLQAGVKEIVVKKGVHGCRVVTHDVDKNIPASPVESVVDSTAAGDSFNAGYLAGRFSGKNCVEAGQQGNTLAATVVQFPGAIIPKEKMPF